jgi:hypothetical protein
VVLDIGHLHHAAALPLKDVEKGLSAGAVSGAVVDMDLCNY